jgi:hypothetical protein
MKPTKEQLADPKWWDENSDGYDYVYHYLGDIEFADKDGRISEGYGLIISDAAWKLLAKRPEAKWVPEVGEWCEAAIDVGELNFNKIKINYISDDVCVYELNNKECVKNTASFIFRPIKTKREEFIERVVYETLNMCSEQLRERIANELYDAGCRFELTEKDGE